MKPPIISPRSPISRTSDLPTGVVDRPAYGRYFVTKAFTNQTDLSSEFNTAGINHAFDLGFEYSTVKQTMARNNDQVLVSDGVTACPGTLAHLVA